MFKKIKEFFSAKTAVTIPIITCEKFCDLSVEGFPLDRWRYANIIATLSIRKVKVELQLSKMASIKELNLVHSFHYLRKVSDSGYVAKRLGIKKELAAEVVKLQRLMVANTLKAVQIARNSGFAFVLGGGLHHATRAKIYNFCIFNDIAIAIEKFRENFPSSKIMIIDLDLHDPNGLRDIYKNDNKISIFSIHNYEWGTAKASNEKIIVLDRANDKTYMKHLKRGLPSFFYDNSPDLIFYVAGVDVAEDDAIGNWELSDKGILERDLFVWRLSKKAEVPLVILTAGGYGNNSWKYTARFILAIANKDLTLPTKDQLTMERTKILSEGIVKVDEITENDLLPARAIREAKFLGRFSKYQIELFLERCGVLNFIRSLGYKNTIVDIYEVGTTYYLKLFGDGLELIDIKVSIDNLSVPGYKLISIDWLMLQNPKAGNSDLLPGQRYKGLGILEEVVALLALVAKELNYDALSFIPSYYHVARMAFPFMKFKDPQKQGEFIAISEALSNYSFQEASWLVSEGKIALNGKTYIWKPSLMIYPLNEKLKMQIFTQKYYKIVESILSNSKVYVDAKSKKNSK